MDLGTRALRRIRRALPGVRHIDPRRRACAHMGRGQINAMSDDQPASVPKLHAQDSRLSAAVQQWRRWQAASAPGGMAWYICSSIRRPRSWASCGRSQVPRDQPEDPAGAGSSRGRSQPAAPPGRRGPADSRHPRDRAPGSAAERSTSITLSADPVTHMAPGSAGATRRIFPVDADTPQPLHSVPHPMDTRRMKPFNTMTCQTHAADAVRVAVPVLVVVARLNRARGGDMP